MDNSYIPHIGTDESGKGDFFWTASNCRCIG